MSHCSCIDLLDFYSMQMNMCIIISALLSSVLQFTYVHLKVVLHITLLCLLVHHTLASQWLMANELVKYMYVPRQSYDT